MNPNLDTQAEVARRQALFERLASAPPSEWRFNDDEAATVTRALADPFPLPAEIHAEVMATVADLRELNTRHAKHLRKLVLWNRSLVWVGLFFSAMFTASYLVSWRLPDLLCAIVWSANSIVCLWRDRRGIRQGNEHDAHKE